MTSGLLFNHAINIEHIVTIFDPFGRNLEIEFDVGSNDIHIEKQVEN